MMTTIAAPSRVVVSAKAATTTRRAATGVARAQFGAVKGFAPSRYVFYACDIVAIERARVHE